jgi:hypothetical protein
VDLNLLQGEVLVPTLLVLPLIITTTTIQIGIISIATGISS